MIDDFCLDIFSNIAVIISISCKRIGYIIKKFLYKC